MLDPDLTRVLRRRIMAFAIDTGLVGLLTLLVGRSRLLPFPISDRDVANEPIYTADQFARLSELAESFNRKFEYGDTLYVIDASGLLITALVGAILSLILFVLLPANTGWSPGKKAMGLRISDFEGNNPSIGSYMMRSVVGLIDLLPIVIPGLVGWVAASKSDFHQRLGDRVARTIVIDARKPESHIDPTVYARQGQARKEATAAAAAADEEPMIDLTSRLGGTHSEEKSRATQGPSHPTAQPAPSEPVSAPTPVGEALPPDIEDAAPRPEPIIAVPEPVSEPTARDPQARIRDLPSIEGLAFDGDIDFAVDEPDAIDTAQMEPDSAAVVTSTPEMHDPGVAPMSRTTPSRDGALPPPPAHRSSPPVDWDRPLAEPAPVWRPEPSELPDDLREAVLPDAEGSSLAASSGSMFSAREAEIPGADVTFASRADDVALPGPDRLPTESLSMPRQSLADPSARERRPSTDQDQPVRGPGPGPGPGARDTTHAEGTGSAPQPTWNAEWQAWLFWDPERKTWLRHDLEADRWIPIG